MWVVADHPALRCSAGGVYRATLSISVSYWLSGCMSFPHDDVTLARLAMLPVAAWREAKPAAMVALQDIMPQLAADHKDQALRLAGQQSHMARVQAARLAAQRLRAATARSGPVVYTPSHASPEPSSNPLVIQERLDASRKSPMPRRPPKPDTFTD